MIRLETGRTHQIRVHMKYIGHPLYGDFSLQPGLPLFAAAEPALLAAVFTHPVSKIPMEFTAPVPNDMQQFLPDIWIQK